MIEPLLLQVTGTLRSTDQIRTTRAAPGGSLPLTEGTPCYDPLEIGRKINELVVAVNDLTRRRDALDVVLEFARQHVLGNADTDYAWGSELRSAVSVLQAHLEGGV